MSVRPVIPRSGKPRRPSAAGISARAALSHHRAWEPCRVTSEMRVEQRAELVVYPTEETDDSDPDALTALLGIPDQALPQG
jgi:hypothetical protein